MTETKIVRATLRGVPALWKSRTPFDCNGTLRGISGGGELTGRLNEKDAAEYKRLSAAGRIAYTVQSYNTVVAWVTTDGAEFKTAQRFSMTTSRHMGRLY